MLLEPIQADLAERSFHHMYEAASMQDAFAKAYKYLTHSCIGKFDIVQSDVPAEVRQQIFVQTLREGLNFHNDGRFTQELVLKLIALSAKLNWDNVNALHELKRAME